MAGDPFYKDHWINIDRDRLLPTSAAVPAIRQSKSLSGSGRAVTCMPWTSIQILSLEHARMRTQLALARGSLCTNVMVPFCLCWTSL